jgi:molecular chaperone GrpE
VTSAEGGEGRKETEQEGPVVRDRRRIDPQTGQVRAPEADTDTLEQGEQDEQEPEVPAATEATAPTAEKEKDDKELKEVKAQLDERTFDLQRLQAEYANYRKRVERDRAAVREQALGSVLNELLPILDDIGRARDHAELTGGFKSVGEALESAVGKLGLEKFGEKGEPFDPTVHEALMHSFSPDVAETTCVEILQPGYRIGEKILRPARVAVAEPGEPDEE